LPVFADDFHDLYHCGYDDAFAPELSAGVGTYMLKLFHEPQGVIYHGSALLYAVSGYFLGLYGLFSSHWLVNLGATLWLSHAMVIAAYLIHECGHNTIFRSNQNNARLGRFLNWICGSSYGTFEDIRYKHFRHHMDNDDSVWFVYDDFWDKYPWLARITQFFEWFYIPMHEFIMHFIMIFSSFIIPQRREQRVRNLIVILIRGGLFFTVLLVYPKAAVLYLVAYILMMQMLRFMDSLQHDYGSNPILFEKDSPSRFGGRATEQLHTFSVPISMKYVPLNWLSLNFGFHNAHHLRPTVPWYRLPEYHREKIGWDSERVVPFSAQLKIFHKYRVCRVLHEGGDLDGRPSLMQEDYLQAVRAGEVYGGNAVSFLVSF
jgi:omega-6 fatty acid desaturase (delta-12 desaturase)